MMSKSIDSGLSVSAKTAITLRRYRSRYPHLSLRDKDAAKVGTGDIYLPITITVKLPGTMDGRGRGICAVGSGRGPNSAVTV